MCVRGHGKFFYVCHKILFFRDARGGFISHAMCGLTFLGAVIEKSIETVHGSLEINFIIKISTRVLSMKCESLFCEGIFGGNLSFFRVISMIK